MGSGLLNLDFGSIISGVGGIIDDLHTSDEEKLKAALQEKAMDVELVKGQLDINRAEAAHRSMFVAGWRPALGWCGAMAIGYKFLLYPLIVWAWVFLQGQGWVPAELSAPPSVDAGELYPIIFGMLGLGGMRSIEKIKQVAK